MDSRFLIESYRAGQKCFHSLLMVGKMLDGFYGFIQKLLDFAVFVSQKYCGVDIIFFADYTGIS